MSKVMTIQTVNEFQNFSHHALSRTKTGLSLTNHAANGNIKKKIIAFHLIKDYSPLFLFISLVYIFPILLILKNENDYLNLDQNQLSLIVID